ncbi:hypothetical protein B0H14DRAFT_3755490 [Mycena olivaceomarginata]|nr:hypothetical protein B0H14DRAFT_3755490 [Mycena olivaceomarginata]
METRHCARTRAAHPFHMHLDASGSIQFCNTEHQKVCWPQQSVLYGDAETCAAKQMQPDSELPLRKLQMMQYYCRPVEVWVEIHAYTLSQARARAVHESGAPVDPRSEYFEFRLTFRPESKDPGPSASFSLDSAGVLPVRGNPLAPCIATTWMSGIMGKKNHGWVWEEHTVDELAAQGIHISGRLRAVQLDLDQLDLDLD